MPTEADDRLNQFLDTMFLEELSPATTALPDQVGLADRRSTSRSKSTASTFVPSTTILGSGSVPLTVQRELVEDWVATQAA